MTKDLEPLVGDWTIEIDYPPDTVRGRVSFEWLEGGGFLVERWHLEDPRFPDGIALLGPSETGDRLVQHYFDQRGVARVYEMSLDGGVWRLWREGDFDQRFTGEFADDGGQLSGRWEKSVEGGAWEHDFDLTFRRVTPPGR